MVSCAIHQHESAMGAHVFRHPELPSHLSPDPIPVLTPFLYLRITALNTTGKILMSLNIPDLSH